MSKIIPTTTTALHPAWDNARNYLAGVQQALRLSIAGQVLVGMELMNLKKDLGFCGNSRNLSPGGQFVHGDRTWSEWVSAELGISYKTADRMILMYDAARARIKKIGHSGDLPGGAKKLALIVDARPATLAPEDREKLAAVVERITDGATQAELLEELRLVKRRVQIEGGDTSMHRKQKEEISVEQLSFTFIFPTFKDNRKLLLSAELPTYLVNLPLEADGEDELSLTSLEAQYRMMLSEIESAKASKIRNLKKAR